MKKVLSVIRRSTFLKLILTVTTICIFTGVDHITLQLLGFTLLLSWQSFAFAVMNKPNLSPWVTTCIGILIDVTSGTVLGYSATLLLFMQMVLLAVYQNSNISPAHTPLMVSFTILLTSILDWLLTCIMLGTLLPIIPAISHKIPAILTLPVFFWFAKSIIRTLERYA